MHWFRRRRQGLKGPLAQMDRCSFCSNKVPMNDVERLPQGTKKVAYRRGDSRFTDDYVVLEKESWPWKARGKRVRDESTRPETEPSESGPGPVRLFAGPNGVHICTECLEVCEEILKDFEDDSQKTPSAAPFKCEVSRCSFCLRSEDEVEHLIAGPTIDICGDCVVRFWEAIMSGPDRAK